jgi:hypothetical protein
LVAASPRAIEIDESKVLATACVCSKKGKHAIGTFFIFPFAAGDVLRKWQEIREIFVVKNILGE